MAPGSARSCCKTGPRIRPDRRRGADGNHAPWATTGKYAGETRLGWTPRRAGTESAQTVVPTERPFLEDVRQATARASHWQQLQLPDRNRGETVPQETLAGLAFQSSAIWSMRNAGGAIRSDAAINAPRRLDRHEERQRALLRHLEAYSYNKAATYASKLFPLRITSADTARKARDCRHSRTGTGKRFRVTGYRERR